MKRQFQLLSLLMLVPFMAMAQQMNILNTKTKENLILQQSAVDSINIFIDGSKLQQQFHVGNNVYTFPAEDVTVSFEIPHDTLVKRQKEALANIYYGMGGDNWEENTNWLSDEPVWKWSRLNRNYYSDGVDTDTTDLVTEIGLNGLANLKKCTTPKGLQYLLGTLDNINMPSFWEDSIYNALLLHPNWDTPNGYKETIGKWASSSIPGWEIVEQLDAGRADTTLYDYKLNIPDGTTYVHDIKSKTASEVYADQIYGKNEYTVIWNCMECIIDAELSFDKSDLNSGRVNLYLDFKDKGVGTVFGCVNSEDYDVRLNDLPANLPDGIEFTNVFFRANFSASRGSHAIVDKTGRVVYYNIHRYCKDEPYYTDESEIERVRERLTKLVGDPVAHETWVPESEDEYKSTDYSHNGEVVTLNQATVSNGYDIVLLGDCYVDTLVNNGTYESRMKEYCEDLFKYEPMKSLKDRVNVYTVKVVSPKGALIANQTEYSEERGIMNDSTAFAYASSIPGIRTDQLHVVAVERPEAVPETFDGEQLRSYCVWYTDNSFCCYLIETQSSYDDHFAETLAHECVGHGIGKLHDEYIEAGEGEFTPDRHASLDNDHQRLWNVNADYRTDLNEVCWNKFLSDSRYSGEALGIYEGAWYSTGIYRPSENSLMNEHYNSKWFNAPGRENIYRMLMQYTEGNEWEYDYETFADFDASGRQQAIENAAASSSSKQIKKDISRYCKPNHKAPVVVNGTWRDALGN